MYCLNMRGTLTRKVTHVKEGFHWYYQFKVYSFHIYMEHSRHPVMYENFS